MIFTNLVMSEGTSSGFEFSENVQSFWSLTICWRTVFRNRICFQFLVFHVQLVEFNFGFFQPKFLLIPSIESNFLFLTIPLRKMLRCISLPSLHPKSSRKDPKFLLSWTCCLAHSLENSGRSICSSTHLLPPSSFPPLALNIAGIAKLLGKETHPY